MTLDEFVTSSFVAEIWIVTDTTHLSSDAPDNGYESHGYFSTLKSLYQDVF